MIYHVLLPLDISACNVASAGNSDTSSLTSCHARAKLVVTETWRQKHSPLAHRGRSGCAPLVSKECIGSVSNPKSSEGRFCKTFVLRDTCLSFPKTMDKMGDFIPMDELITGMPSNHDGDIVFLDQNVSLREFEPFRLAEEVSFIGSTQYNMGQHNTSGNGMFHPRGNNNMAQSQNRRSPLDQLGNGQHHMYQSESVQHQMDQPWNGQHQMDQPWNGQHQMDQSWNGQHQMTNPGTAASNGPIMERPASNGGQHQMDQSRNGQHQMDQSWNGQHQMDQPWNGQHQMDQSWNGQHQMDQSRNGQHQMDQSRSVQNQARNRRRRADQSGSSRNHTSRGHGHQLQFQAEEREGETQPDNK
ncbi:hypothetical protein C7M84_004856 [Penaeus vannamei]|uniref:Uncharacterized protein n=1 Tax=Penaeus vannamei TaxID=6689 RepID=A0A3R7PTE3_PENVA|nr:hypothetical protein C7M84_004856 [Penaeus vannamei]